MLYLCCTAVLDLLMLRNISTIILTVLIILIILITLITLTTLIIINTSQNIQRVCKLSAVINE